MSNTGGRPTVITDSTVRKLEAALRDGLSVQEACFVSGIGRTAFYQRKASDSVFANKVELAKSYVTLKAKHVVVQAITADGDLPMSKWWLERKARNEFGTNAIDEDAQWEAQHTTASEEDDALRRILDMMSDTAEVAIDEVATESHIAQQSTQSEVITHSPVSPTPESLQPALAQHTPALAAYDTSHDVVADLYDED